MGKIFSLTCKNKECSYSVQLREGPGFSLFARDKDLEKSILSGEEKVTDEIKALLEKGLNVNSVTTLLCPCCKEYQICMDPYIFEPIHESPSGTIKDYKIHFIYGDPCCEKCNTKLIHILNPRSSKNKCPKCGIGEMRYSETGFYD